MILVYNALSLVPDVADGAATFSLNVLEHLPAVLNNDDFIVLACSGETRIRRGPNVTVKFVNRVGGAGARILHETFLLERTLRRVRADVFVSPNESMPLRLPCPAVVVAQNLVYHRDGWRQAFQGATAAQRVVSRVQAAYYRRAMPAAYRRAARIAAVSDTTARVLATKAGLDLDKTDVIYEGSNSILMPVPRGGVTRSRLLAVGTLAPYKGLQRAIELFALLHRVRPELELEIVGSSWRGFGSVLSDHARRYEVEGAVRFVGALGGHELAQRYETALLLIHLSECESFGLPVAEAMYYGLPVVSSGSSSLREVTGGAALEISRNLDDAASAVLGLIDDPDQYQRLSDRGRRRAAELTWRATAERLGNVIRAAGSG